MEPIRWLLWGALVALLLAAVASPAAAAPSNRPDPLAADDVLDLVRPPGSEPCRPHCFGTWADASLDRAADLGRLGP